MTLATGCLAGSYISVHASDGNTKIKGFYHTSWTAKEGAPGDLGLIAQTTNGYIWLATPRGLFHFDGISFERYRSPSGKNLQKDHVQALFASADGGLWVSYYLGGLSFIKDGQITDYVSGKDLPVSPIMGIVGNRQGSVWARLTDGSVLHREGARWNLVGSEWGFTGRATAMMADDADIIWVSTPDAIYYLLSTEKTFHLLQGHAPGVVANGRDGEVLILPARGGPDAEGNRRGGKGDASARAFTATQDNQRGIWFCTTHDGLSYAASSARLYGKNAPSALEPFTAKDGLTSDDCTGTLKDREGNIWVTTNLGLDQFRQSAVIPVEIPVGSSKFALGSREGGGIWATSYFGPPGGGLMGIRSGKIDFTRSVSGPMSSYSDEQGVLWIGTRGKGKVLRWYGGAMKEIDTPSDMTGAITKDLQGRLWVLLSGKGYARLENGQWTKLASLGGPEHGCLTSFTDGSGRIWFGCQRNEIAILNGDKISLLSDKDGISVGDVTTIRGRLGNIWISGERGLEMFDGHRFVPVLPADGSGFTDLTGIIATQDDGLWIGESRGITHIPESEIREFQKDFTHHVLYRTFGALDGLPAPLQGPYPAPAAVQDTEGLIWFATASGVVWIDPKHLPVNTLSPPVSILHPVFANNKSFDAADWSLLRLPARTTSIKIAYTALSFSIPGRVRFRYRLDGLDQGWQEAGTQREAVYNNLGPGTYKFRVTACNSDGVWNETGSALDFIIAPAYYQTWWFKLVYFAAAAGALWFFYLYRLKRATARIQQRLGAQLEERERIARELHDTLLQGFQGLMLRFQAVMKMLPADERAHQVMGQVLDRADEVLLEGRQSVRDLREGGTNRSELPEALLHCGEELANDHTSLFSLTVLGEPRPLDPIVFKEAYCIGREALINAFQHAQATKIEVEVGYSDSGVCLRVRDNGTGIDAAVISKGRAGHWGLSGMRERAQKIGAQVKIWSQPGAGTEIELEILAKVADPHWEQRTPWQRMKHPFAGRSAGYDKKD
jgi:signal transduction histidine kinase